MRESRTFAERAKVLKSDEARKKYFLVYEGSDTEVIYFDAICALREDIGISPLIELIPIIRSFSEEGWSNPKKILDRVIENLQEICSEQLQKSLYDKVDDIENSCKKVLDALKNQYEVVNIVGDISGIIREGGLTYEEGFDQICLIVDRDRESFLSKPENNQYKYVLDKCREMNFFSVLPIHALNSGYYYILMKCLNWIKKSYWRIPGLLQKDGM